MLLAARQWMSDLLNLAYPGRCVVCQGPSDGANRFCDDCDTDMRALEERLSKL